MEKTLFKKEAPKDVTPPPFVLEQPGEAATVRGIEYKVEENINVKIEWTKRGRDYIYHWHPKRPPVLDVESVRLLIIAAVHPTMPHEVQMYFSDPDPSMRIEFYTVRLENVANMPGAQTACEKTVIDALKGVDAWGS
jgi:hypothetical protein